MSKKSALQEKFEKAIEQGLISESSAERTQALRSAGDLLSPALGELTARAKAAEERLEFSNNSLKEVQGALDAANAKVVELQPLVGMQAELRTLKETLAGWKAEQVTLLTDSSTQQRFKNEAILRASEENLREANNKVSSSGWQELRSTLADLIARYEISAPDFWSTSNAMPSAFFTLWPDWTPRRAAVWCALKSSWSTDSPEFRAAGLRVFIAAQEVFPGEPPRNVVPDLAERKSFFEVQSKRFGNGCYEEIAKQSEAYRIQRHGQFLRNHNMQIAVQELDHAAHGLTRDPIRVDEGSMSSIPISEHLEGCLGKCCAGRGVRLPNSMDEVEI